jgi:hypothetical protein
MKNPLVVSSVLVLVANVAGCGGGGPMGMLRDGTNIYSELVDSMRKVVDQKSAQKFATIDARRFQEQWEKHGKRLENFVRFGDDADVEQLAFLWLGDVVYSKGTIGPVALMLKAQEGPLAQRLDKAMKKESPPKEGQTLQSLTPDAVAKGGLVIKRSEELIARKGVQHLFAESQAARRLLDQQIARIKSLKPPEDYAGLDFKGYTGEQ